MKCLAFATLAVLATGLPQRGIPSCGGGKGRDSLPSVQGNGNIGSGQRRPGNNGLGSQRPAASTVAGAGTQPAPVARSDVEDRLESLKRESIEILGNFFNFIEDQTLVFAMRLIININMPAEGQRDVSFSSYLEPCRPSDAFAVYTRFGKQTYPGPPLKVKPIDQASFGTGSPNSPSTVPPETNSPETSSSDTASSTLGQVFEIIFDNVNPRRAVLQDNVVTNIEPASEGGPNDSQRRLLKVPSLERFNEREELPCGEDKCQKNLDISIQPSSDTNWGFIFSTKFVKCRDDDKCNVGQTCREDGSSCVVFRPNGEAAAAVPTDQVLTAPPDMAAAIEGEARDGTTDNVVDRVPKDSVESGQRTGPSDVTASPHDVPQGPAGQPPATTSGEGGNATTTGSLPSASTPPADTAQGPAQDDGTETKPVSCNPLPADQLNKTMEEFKATYPNLTDKVHHLLGEVGLGRVKLQDLKLATDKQFNDAVIELYMSMIEILDGGDMRKKLLQEMNLKSEALERLTARDFAQLMVVAIKDLAGQKLGQRITEALGLENVKPKPKEEPTADARESQGQTSEETVDKKEAETKVDEKADKKEAETKVDEKADKKEAETKVDGKTDKRARKRAETVQESSPVPPAAPEESKNKDQAGAEAKEQDDAGGQLAEEDAVNFVSAVGELLRSREKMQKVVDIIFSNTLDIRKLDLGAGDLLNAVARILGLLTCRGKLQLFLAKADAAAYQLPLGQGLEVTAAHVAETIASSFENADGTSNLGKAFDWPAVFRFIKQMLDGIVSG
ncbi:hypothetical protein CDD83_7991 [Cordyceps sp. RAO-2017]|nr:hypothetical protein CDD83_7991 [Cordyceps sp. RAO-2017]